MKDLAVVIVNYNVKHFLEQTLVSVFKALKGIDAEVFVVDNDSADGSVEYIEKRFPDAKIIANKVNVGFSKANNQAIRESNSKYVLLLNPDTVVEENTFSKCIEFMDSHSNCGGLGVKMVDGSGNFLPESKRGLPTPSVAFYKIFGLASFFPNSQKFGKYHLTYLDKEKTHKVDVLSGAFMFLRSETLEKSGLLDEDYFMYGEDIDLSYKIQKAGYENYYYPGTRIIHYKGESTKKGSVNYVFVFYRAMAIFAKKHFSSSNAWLFSFIINIAIYLRASMALFSRAIKQASWFVFDVVSVFGGMFFLKTYWEDNHKWVPGNYPAEYMSLAVPIYIFIWLSSIYVSGGYDKPFKISKVLRGVFIGGLIISAISNFVDPFRYSKALIILGTFYTALSVVFSRYIAYFIKYRNFEIEESPYRRITLVGNNLEIERVKSLLNGNAKIDIVGNIYLDNTESSNSLGSIERLSDLIELYKLDEVVFCAKGIPSAQIITWMTANYNREVEFRIVPDDSNFIIGSNSKNTQGDYYSFEIEFNINQAEKLREKRLMDIFTSACFILLFPLLIFTKNKFKNIYYAFQVLFAKKSWVGVRSKSLNFKHIREGVFSPSDGKDIDQITKDRLDFLYAKDYSVGQDLAILFANL